MQAVPVVSLVINHSLMLDQACVQAEFRGSSAVAEACILAARRSANLIFYLGVLSRMHGEITQVF